MPAESASAASTTAINAAGGSISENSPTVWVIAIVALVAIFWLWSRKNGGR